jgi:DnaJ-domain-containing protein 1
LTQDDHDILYDQAQRNDLNRIADWIQNSDFVEFIFERSQFKKQLRAAEDRLEAVKRDMKPVEDKMAQAMKNGIKSVLR